MRIRKYIIIGWVSLVFAACTDKYQSLEDLNTAPQITLSKNKITVRIGDQVTDAGKIVLKCTDRENNAIHYRLVDGTGKVKVMFDHAIAHENIVPIISVDSTVVKLVASELGSYDVKFFVSDRFGKRDSARLQIQTIPNKAPKAQLSVKLLTGREYKLDAARSADPDGIIRVYHFEIDGTNINSPVPTINHVFYSAGIKTIKLVVEDDTGSLSPVITKTVNVP